MFTLPIPPQPLTIKGRRGCPAGSVRVNASTHREPFAQNTGYTRGRGRGRGRRLGRRLRRGFGAGASARVGVLAKAVHRH